MDTKNLTCICCPLGCALTVAMQGDKVHSVSGNTCKRGDDYARKEVTHPTRTVTSTVAVAGGSLAMVSVKTKSDVPKEKMMDIMQSLAHIIVDAPVHAGDVILPDAADTGISIIATKDVGKAGEN